MPSLADISFEFYHEDDTSKTGAKVRVEVVSDVVTIYVVAPEGNGPYPALLTGTLALVESASESASASASPSKSASASPSASPSTSASASPSLSPSASPSASESASPSVSPSSSPS